MLDAALAFFGLQRRGSAQVFEGANAPALRWTVENGQIWASFPFTGGPVSTGSSAGNNPPPPAAPSLVPPGTVASSPIPAVSSHGVPSTSSQLASPPRDEAVGTEPGLHSTAPSESPEGNSTNQTDWPNGYQRREIPLDNVINVPRNRRSQTKWVTRSTGNRAHAESANRKAERRGCLGVLQCETCRSLKRPHTQPDSLKQQLIKNCTYARCRDPRLQHIQCGAYTLQWEAQTDGGVVLIWEHHGEHDHGQPPDARLSQEEQERVDEQVALRPDASAHQLRTGSLTPGSVPLGEISEKLANPRKARAALSKSRERLGLQPESHKGAAGFLKGVETLFEETIKEPFLIGSGLVRPAYICVQTDFMRKVLYDAVQDWLRAAAEGPDVGRHGSVTDGDNSFFSQGNVITTCMFNLTANQWAPVLYTWMLHVDTDHYRIHFLQLNRDLIKAAGDKFDRRLLSGVFDFSAAQRLAHEQAFADAIIGTMPQWSMLGPKAQEAQRQELCEEARKHQKGCESHFRTSVKRVKQSHELVPPDQRESFDDLIATFLSSDTTSEEFDDAAHTMRKRFPKVNSWLSWWLSKQFASMIFPAKRSMSTALARELPNTSNPVENRHSQLHHGTGVHQDIIPGLHNLYLHVKALERETKSIIDGHATASARIETKRPPRNVHFYENDGRAPDTVERLQATEASTSGTGKRRARGSNRSNAPKKQVVATPIPPKNKATASKTVAQQDNSLLLVDPRAQLRRLQSYQWANNSCFIDVGLELWFEAYSRWTTEEQLSFLRDQAMLGSPLHSICLNFKNRASWIAAPGLPTKQPGAQVVSSLKGKTREVWYAEEDNIARGFDILDVSQRAVRNAVIEWAKSPNNRALETFRNGSASFGETRAVFKNAIMDKTTLRAKLQFAIRHRVLLNCTHGHNTSSYTTIPTPILPLCSHDNARAGLACGFDTVGLDNGVESVDIGRYLSHLLPRLQGSSVASYNSGERLCEIEPPTCAYPQCGQDTTLQAIRTEWPRILHIVPETSHNNDPQLASINPSPVQFTIAFDIWSQRHDAAGYVNPASLDSAESGSQPAVSVRYELFGRLIFHEDRAHYTAQVIIGDRSYLYDDMVREGVLADIGPKEAILAPTAGVAMVLYHRVSESNVTEQDIEYLRNTPKDISHIVAKQQPIMIPDSSDESSVGKPLAQVRKAVRKPKQTKSKILAQPGNPGPAVTGPPSRQTNSQLLLNEHGDLEEDQKFETFLQGIGQLHYRASAEPSVASSGDKSVVNCSGCDITEDVGNMIQCSACGEWSHQDCIRVQHGLSLLVVANCDARWDCPQCDTNTPLWDDSIIGQYILHTTIPDGPLYPAQILRREGFNAVVEWYYGNHYGGSGRRGSRKEQPKSNLIKIPIHRCAAAARDREWTHGRKARIGMIKWPLRLFDNAHDLYSYTNAEITTALEDAFPSVLGILCREREHPIIEKFTEGLRKGIPKIDDSLDFVQKFNALVLPGDDSLIHTYITLLNRIMYRRMLVSGTLPVPGTGRAWTGDWITALVNGPGIVLFRLVILRLYLQKSPSYDYEIYRIVIGALDETNAHEEQVKAQRAENSQLDNLELSADLSSSASGTWSDSQNDILAAADAPFQPSLRITRRMTVPEQAYAACLHWRSTDSWDGQESQPSLEPTKQRVQKDDALVLRYDPPLAFVETRPGTDAYAWPDVGAQVEPGEHGLTGGTPFAMLVQEVDGAGPDAELRGPKPRPRPVAKKSIPPTADGPREGGKVSESGTTTRGSIKQGEQPEEEIGKKRKSARLSGVMMASGSTTKKTKKG